jgi:hypothetical protein
MIIKTLQDFQDRVHANYEVTDINTPLLGSDDWNVRVSLCNQAVDEWDVRNRKWDELYKMLNQASDGDKIATLGQKVFNAPTDFERPVSDVKVALPTGAIKFFTYIRPQNLYKYAFDTTTPYYYITGEYTGALGGYQLNIMNGNFLGGEVVDYPYYRQPRKMSVPTDLFDMRDPNFAVEWVLEKLHEGDSQEDRGQLAVLKSELLLQAMLIANLDSPYLAMDKELFDDEPMSSGFGV